jgi:type IV secretory pathway VirB6-like protein
MPKLNYLLARHVLSRLWVMMAYLALFAVPATARAQLPETLPGSSISLDSLFEELDNGLITRLVVAIKAGLENIVLDVMLDRVYTMWEPVIGLIVLLAVILFGIKLISGAVDSPWAEIPITVIKIAFVIEFTRNMGEWVPLFFDITEDLMGIVSGAFEGLADIGCDEYIAGADVSAFGLDPAFVRPWLLVDCLFIQFLALAMGGTAISALIGFLVSTAVSGHFGVVITFAGISAMSGLLFSVLRTGYMFASSMMSLAFAFVLSPFFVPMLLFQATVQYFEKWLKLTISFILQPVLLAVFVMFMAIFMNEILYKGDFSICQALNPNPEAECTPASFQENLDRFVSQCASEQFTATVSSDQTVRDATDIANAPEQSTTASLFGRTAKSFLGLFMQGFDMETCFAGFNLNEAAASMDTTFFMNRIMMSLFTLMIGIMLINSMLDAFDQMLPFLVEQSFRLKLSYQLPGEQRFQTALDEAKKAAMRSEGMGFLPGAISGNMDTVTRAYVGGRDAQGNVTPGALNTFVDQLVSVDSNVSGTLPLGAGNAMMDLLWSRPNPNQGGGKNSGGG